MGLSGVNISKYFIPLSKHPSWDSSYCLSYLFPLSYLDLYLYISSKPFRHPSHLQTHQLPLSNPMLPPSGTCPSPQKDPYEFIDIYSEIILPSKVLESCDKAPYHIPNLNVQQWICNSWFHLKCVWLKCHTGSQWLQVLLTQFYNSLIAMILFL